MDIYEEIMKMREQMPQDRVPGAGMAADLEGECLRAFDRVVYRFYNDGDLYTSTDEPQWSDLYDNGEDIEGYHECYGDGYNTVSPSLEFLSDYAPSKELRTVAEAIMNKETSDMGDYEAMLLELCKAMATMDWSKSTPNTVDSRTFEGR